jgi:hypothetical protein
VEHLGILADLVDFSVGLVLYLQPRWLWERNAPDLEQRLCKNGVVASISRLHRRLSSSHCPQPRAGFIQVVIFLGKAESQQILAASGRKNALPATAATPVVASRWRAFSAAFFPGRLVESAST